jgi:hypothetical protein
MRVCKQTKSHAFLITIAPRCRNMSRGWKKSAACLRFFGGNNLRQSGTPRLIRENSISDNISHDGGTNLLLQTLASPAQCFFRAVGISTLAVCVVPYLGYRSNGLVEMLFMTHVPLNSFIIFVGLVTHIFLAKTYF